MPLRTGLARLVLLVKSVRADPAGPVPLARLPRLAGLAVLLRRSVPGPAGRTALASLAIVAGPAARCCSG
ncbi:hypothetical protein HBB16_18645 [Pseudonocardia sp. MCCB 268]|nr:hypothetical protein [Pseudonocardia cytotoxica]